VSVCVCLYFVAIVAQPKVGQRRSMTESEWNPCRCFAANPKLPNVMSLSCFAGVIPFIRRQVSALALAAHALFTGGFKWRTCVEGREWSTRPTVEVVLLVVVVAGSRRHPGSAKTNDGRNRIGRARPFQSLGRLGGAVLLYKSSGYFVGRDQSNFADLCLNHTQQQPLSKQIKQIQFSQLAN
jgi:hypothetical protein